MKLVVAGVAVALLAAVAPPVAELQLRTRVEAFRGTGDWREASISYRLEPSKSAIIVCDMWDRHWCRGATGRVNGLARKANPVLALARSKGMLIVHAPSDTMDFYRDAPQRRAILQMPRVAPPAPLGLSAPKLPIDDSDGGCDTPGDKTFRAWSRQHPEISIGEQDLISDNGEEVYGALKARGIETLFILGVHTNMCILNRSFAIRQMTNWGVRAILVRDLTDAMYDPADAPYVSHEAGTELVIGHIERHWCPTVLSSQLVRALSGGR